MENGHWAVAVVTTGEATSALVPAPAPRRLRTRGLAAPPPCRGRRLRTIVSRGAAADRDRVPFQLCLLSQCLLCSSANFQDIQDGKYRYSDLKKL